MTKMLINNEGECPWEQLNLIIFQNASNEKNIKF